MEIFSAHTAIINVFVTAHNPENEYVYTNRAQAQPSLFRVIEIKSIKLKVKTK